MPSMPQSQGTALLLFDDAPIVFKRGVSRRMTQPTRCEHPILTPEKPWELNTWSGDPGASVLQDVDGTCHLWYMLKFADQDAPENPPELKAADLDLKTLGDLQAPPRYILCYARSDDGVHWERPDCGVFEYGGSTANNIILSGRLGGTVFIDPKAPPEARLKMLYGDGPKLPYRKACEDTASRHVYHAIYGASSPDGIHWTKTKEPVLPWYTDTTNVAYWDDQRRKYVAFVRCNHGMVYEDDATVVHNSCFYRAIGRSETADFSTFPKPEMILAPPETLWSPAETGTDYYNTAAMKYPYAPDAYFLFISMFCHLTGRLDVYLASSRNGVDYDIWPEPFVELGQDGEFDARCMYMAAGTVDAGAEFYMYYRGYSYVHRCVRHPYGSYPVENQPVGFGRLRVRKDGFVAQVFSPDGGELLTRPVEVTDPVLTLNADCGGCGELRVEVHDEAGRQIPGFSADECVPVWGNTVAAQASWNDAVDLSQFVGHRVSLRITGRQSKLYALRFQKDQNNGNTI